jgi:O-antigen/teichoic acid export membrane protein
MRVLDQILSQIFRNVAETYFAQLARIAGGLAFNIWFTRLLAPADRGYYGVAIAVALIGAQFGQTGLNTANTYFSAKQPGVSKSLLGNSTLAVFTIAPVLLLIIFLVTKAASGSIATTRQCLTLSMCYIPFALGYFYFQGLLLGTHQIRKYNFLEIINRYVPLAALAFLVWIGKVTSTTVLAGVLFGQIVACLWAWGILYRTTDGMAVSWPLMGNMFRYGIKIHLATVFSFLLLRADLLMVAHMRNAEEAGYYSLATSLAEYMGLPAFVVGTILLPHLSVLNDTKRKFQMMLHWLGGVSVVTIPLFVFAGFLGHPIIRWVCGPRYLPSLPGFLWLLPGVYFLGLSCVSVQFITSIGYKLSVSAVWFLALVLNLSGNFYAIHRYGFVGASIMSSICYGLVFIFIFLIAWKHRKFDENVTQSAFAAVLPENGISHIEPA